MDKAPEAFRTISEVADELEVPKHVLRFWEAKFVHLKPMKRGGGRRYYRPEDVALLRGIRLLLYNEGYTIRGVQKILKQHGPRYVMDYRRSGTADHAEEGAMPRPPVIPDIAAETAQGNPPNLTRDLAETRGSKLEKAVLIALLDELDDCRRILTEAKS
ncbi:MAG: MerR family transcriptional regulator [Methyloceanibacter sp.]